MRLRFAVLLLLGSLAACHRQVVASPEVGARVPAPEPVATGLDVLRRAAAAFPAAPQTVAFTQVNTVTLSSGNITQRQRVLVRAPGRMRVDFLPLASRNGALYVEGRAYTFAAGRRAAAQANYNPLLLLGFSLYRQQPEESRAALESLGVRTSLVREARWNGRPVWVIGAARGDTTSNQVWFDAERWVPLRVIQSEKVGTRTRVSDTRFLGHTAAQPTIPRAMTVHRDGKLALQGTFEDVRVGVTVPAAAFDTTSWRAAEY